MYEVLHKIYPDHKARMQVIWARAMDAFANERRLRLLKLT